MVRVVIGRQLILRLDSLLLRLIGVHCSLFPSFLHVRKVIFIYESRFSEDNRVNLVTVDLDRGFVFAIEVFFLKTLPSPLLLVLVLALNPDNVVVVFGFLFLFGHLILVELEQLLDGHSFVDGGGQIGKGVSKVDGVATVVQDVVSDHLREQVLLIFVNPLHFHQIIFLHVLSLHSIPL